MKDFLTSLLPNGYILNGQILPPNSDFNFSDILVSSDQPLQNTTIALFTLAKMQRNSQILKAPVYSPISFQPLNSPILLESFNNFIFNEVNSQSTQLTDNNISVSSSTTSFAEDSRGFDFEVTIVDRGAILTRKYSAYLKPCPS